MEFAAAYSMCRQTFHQKRPRFPTPFIGIEIKRAKVELSTHDSPFGASLKIVFVNVLVPEKLTSPSVAKVTKSQGFTEAFAEGLANTFGVMRFRCARQDWSARRASGAAETEGTRRRC